MRRKLAIAALVAGIALLALNLAGFVWPMRNPSLESDPNDVVADDPIRVAPADFWRQATRRDGESDRAYVERSTSLVDDAVAHWWPDDAANNRYGIRVPLRENYVLWSLAPVVPRVYRKYEFCSAVKGVERGVGFCSQSAIVLVTILRDNGVDASIVGLDGHVVVHARVEPDRWIVADPDWGIVFDHDLRELEANPSIVRAAYRATGASDGLTRWLETVYSPAGNVIVGGVEEFAPTAFAMERVAYTVKWALPALLILVGAFAGRRR